MKVTDRACAGDIVVENVTVDTVEELIGLENGEITPHSGQTEYLGNGAYYLHFGWVRTVTAVDTTAVVGDGFSAMGNIAGERVVTRSEGEQRIAADAGRLVLQDTQKQTAGQRIARARLLVSDGLGMDAGQFIDGQAIDLSGLDRQRFERIVADGIDVRTFAEMLRCLDLSGSAARILMQQLAGASELRRWYDGDNHRGRNIAAGTDQLGLYRDVGGYYESAERTHGMCLNLVGLFVALGLAAIEAGRDTLQEVLYVSSDVYTREAGFKEKVAALIARNVAARGITGVRFRMQLVSGDFTDWDRRGAEVDAIAMMRSGQRLTRLVGQE